MNYTKLIDKARNLNNERKFAEAIEIFEQTKEEGKDDVKWYYRYAYALNFTNQFKKAIDLLETGLTKDLGDFPYVHLLLGQLYYRQGKLVEAFKLVEAGKEKCKTYEPDSVWEFDQTVRSMFMGEPYANAEDWSDSVLCNDFPDYDDSVDREDDVKDVEKEKEALAEYFGDYERELVSFNIYINARLQPKHRHNFEDYLEYEIVTSRLGIIFYPETEETEELPLGDYDVFAIGLDSMGLEDDVYEEHSIVEVFETTEAVFDDACKFIKYFFYDETEEEDSSRMWIRYLCSDYEKMEDKLKQVLCKNPLCKNAIFINETNISDNQELKKETIFRVPGEDNIINNAMEEARKTFKYFWREVSWDQKRVVPALSTACVKIAFAEPKDNASNEDEVSIDDFIIEHMWINEVYYDGEFIYGVLINEPQDISNIRMGDQVCAPLDQLSDWMFAIAEGDEENPVLKTYGAFTVQAMRSQMSEEKLAEHDKSWGLDFGDYNEVLVAYGQKENPEVLIEHPLSINSAESLQKYLDENPDSVNEQDSVGYTMLHNECIAGNLTCVKALIEKGADKNLQTQEGKTALDFAKQLEWNHIVEYLEDLK